MKRLLVSLLLMGVGGVFALSLPLRVKNMSAYAYNGVPVQVGIPFPQGKLTVSDLAKLTVSDAMTHQALPAGVARGIVWHDGSIKWIRLIFPATVAVGATANYILSDAGKNTLGGLTAVQNGNSVTVNTGPLKFTVKGGNFNLIDEAWSNESAPGVFDDAHKIIDPGNAGGFYIKIGATEYRSNTVNATVSLVDNNPYYALIRASGKVNNYTFTCFYYAYYGKPYVKVVHHFYYDNSDGTASSHVTIADLSLRLKTRVAGGSGTFSGTAGDVTTAIGAADEALLYYANEDAYVIRKGTTTLGSGKGMNEGTQGAKNVGWAHMDNGSLGVGACVKWMWEMAPKNISLHGDGEVGVHLYSNKGPALDFYGGTGRTHFTGFAFTHSAAVVKEMFYAISQPLYAAAPTQWLTWQTRAFGDLVPCEAQVFNENVIQTVNQYKMMGFKFGHPARKAAVDGEDSYGWIEFGDLSEPNNGCAGRHWANNYYDFPHSIAQAFAMTGSEYNLESGTAHALHLADMDHNAVTGQSRTCPGWGNFGDYTLCEIGFSPSANHYKCQGLFDWANLLGEPILGESGLRVAQWAKGYPSGELRSVGHVMESLAAAYGYSNDVQWKNSLQNFYSVRDMSATATGDNNFMQAIIGEGLMWTLNEIPGYAPALTALQAWADKWAQSYDYTQHMIGDYQGLAGWYLGAFGYAWSLFPARQAAWSPAVKDLWQRWNTVEGLGGEGKIKTFTQQFRGTPHYFHVAAKTGYNPSLPDYWGMSENVVTGVERPSTGGAFDLNVQPNPFRSATVVHIGARVSGSAQVGVFDLAGRKVASLLSAPSKPGAAEYRWDAAGFPAGIYLVKAEAAGARSARKIILTK